MHDSLYIWLKKLRQSLRFLGVWLAYIKTGRGRDKSFYSAINEIANVYGKWVADHFGEPVTFYDEVFLPQCSKTFKNNRD